ncbi:MAG: hypothetical protein J5663_05955 [Bacteroidaceae bacterium]|nr:hypothetical protein [Bacteroidaceae bacterium]
MKRIIISSLAALLTITMSAQENPERGFVITNDNDTIYGMIDFRTDDINAQQCYFKSDNTDEYKYYYPGQIVGYRFMRNGKLYVSKELEYDGLMHQLFAEYMVKGMLNVYRVKGLSWDDIYFFENENGKIVAYRNSERDSSADDKEITKNAQNLFSFLAPSSINASEAVKIGKMSTNQILDIAKIYHDDVCTSGEDCIKYEYDEKSDKNKSAFFAYAGVSHFFSGDVMEYASVSPFVGIGWDINQDRIAKGMTLQVTAEFFSLKQTETFSDGRKETSSSLVPFLKFGAQNKTGKDKSAKFTYRYGFTLFPVVFCIYGGIGTEIPIESGGACVVMLNGCSPCILSSTEGYKGYISASIGYKF